MIESKKVDTNLTDEERFWAKVDKSGDCWLWTGSRNSSGYGKLKCRGQYWYAHRLSYTWACGDIPEGYVVDHLCHNTSCIRPEHLQAVTQAENTQNRGGAQRNSSTGIRGVIWHKSANRWVVQTSKDKRAKYQSAHPLYELHIANYYSRVARELEYKNVQGAWN